MPILYITIIAAILAREKLQRLDSVLATGANPSIALITLKNNFYECVYVRLFKSSLTENLINNRFFY